MRKNTKHGQHPPFNVGNSDENNGRDTVDAFRWVKDKMESRSQGAVENIQSFLHFSPYATILVNQPIMAPTRKSTRTAKPPKRYSPSPPPKKNTGKAPVEGKKEPIAARKGTAAAKTSAAEAKGKKKPTARNTPATIVLS